MENSDIKTADQLDFLLKYVYDKGNADHYWAQSVAHEFKVGMSLVGFYMDYTEDPVNGSIKFFWKSYNSFLLDPYFRDRSLTDCSRVIIRDYVTRNDAKLLLPKISEKEIDTLPSNAKDDKFLSLPERNSFYDCQDLLTYDQYFVRTTRDAEFIVDFSTGYMQELPREEIKKQQIIEQAAKNPNIDIILRRIPTIQRNVLLAQEVVDSGPDPSGIDDYPFVVNACYYDPDMTDFSIKMQGFARPQRSVQREINKRNSKYIDIIDKNLYAGFFYKPSKLLDEESIWQTGQGQNIPMKDNAEFGRDISPIPAPQIPPGILEYSQSLMDLSNRIIGVNEDMLGISKGGNNLVSGTLAQIRASNGLRSNRAVFDDIEYTQKHLASRVLKAIQLNFNEFKVKRILNEEPTEQFYNSFFEKYDANITQSVKTQNQRQQYYMDLIQAVQLGIDIPSDIIIENIPLHNKSEFIERMKQKDQEKAAQQQKMEEAEAFLKKTQSARSIADIALAVERISRAEADSGLAKERISEMQQNAAQANLDQIRAAKELQDMDIEQAIKALQFVQQLNMHSQAITESRDKQQENEARELYMGLTGQVEQASQPNQQDMNNVSNQGV
jgi:hypothetical protein